MEVTCHVGSTTLCQTEQNVKYSLQIIIFHFLIQKPWYVIVLPWSNEHTLTSGVSLTYNASTVIINVKFPILTVYIHLTNGIVAEQNGSE